MLGEIWQHMPSSVLSGLCMNSTSNKANSRQHNMLLKEDCVLASQLAAFDSALHTSIFALTYTDRHCIACISSVSADLH